jgi:hypothetical protein
MNRTPGGVTTSMLRSANGTTMSGCGRIGRRITTGSELVG